MRIVDLLDLYYNSIKGIGWLSRMSRFFIRLFVNIILPIYFALTNKNKDFSIPNSNIDDSRVIVSLTSFPLRIGRVWLVIETILRQRKKPHKIIIWLSKEEFPTLEVLPVRLLNQRERGLEIRLVEDNIGSHKKYYYALQAFPNDILLTIDDDMFYRSTMIEDMFKYSLKFPEAVICQYGLKMEWKNGNLQAYNTWKKLKEKSSSNEDIFFGSGGGTIFPSLSLFPDVLNKNIFINLTPIADDIWLNAMCRLNNTKIIKTDYSSNLLPVMNLRNSTLYSENINSNKNDIQIRNVREYYRNQIGKDPFEK